MSPRKLTLDIQNDAISAAGDTFFPKPHMFVCFFQNFQGCNIYHVYIYVPFNCFYPDVSPFNCLLLKLQSPTTPVPRTFVGNPPPRGGHPAPSVLPWRLLPWEPSNGGSLQMGGVFSPPTQMGVSVNGGTPKTPQNDHF